MQNEEAIIAAAERKIEEKEYDTAIEMLENISKKIPNYYKAQFYLGLAYDKNGNYEDAITCWKKIPKDDKSYYSVQINIGVAYAKKGEYDTAITYWEKIPEGEYYDQAQFNLGVVYYEKGEYDTAITYWEKIPEGEYYYPAQVNIGIAYTKNGNYDKAIEILEKIPEGEYYYPAQVNLGVAYIRKGEYDTAIEILEKIPEGNEDYYLAQIHLGVAYAKKGDDNIAIKILKSGLKKNNPEFLSNSFLFINLFECVENKKNNQDKKIKEQYEQIKERYFKESIEYERQFNLDNIEQEPNGAVYLYQYMRFTKETLLLIQQEQLFLTDPQYFNDPMDPPLKCIENFPFKELPFRVACLAREYNNILMWSHYADRHQGICIKYDISKLIQKPDEKIEKIVLKKIQYHEKCHFDGSNFILSNLDSSPPSKNTPSKNVHSLLDLYAYKHNSWKYEQEYRLIKRGEGIQIENCRIKAIYLGKNISPENEKSIEEIIKNKTIKLIKMKNNLTDNLFELKEEELKKEEVKKD